ncbi:MAG: oligosaccharyl transferase, archaeosortase A system-associated [Dehalococcoidia bacterium]|nr:oligosaccharyl transferase, archaeosortase A system-associated [Dehalococcoidia bacterium]
MDALDRASRFCKGLLLSFLQGMEKSVSVQRVIVGIAIAAFFAAALYLRIAFSYDVVFGGEWVKFTGVDAYWHVRIVDNLAHNFPHLSNIDPYLRYPGGGVTSYQFPFFDYLLAGVIWIIGLGSPTQHTVDTIAPYFPPVMAALTIVPVYFIGKTLFSRWAGVFAAGLVAILPGEFLGRSILGFTDHHVAETLFSTTAVMFLVLAVKNAKKEQISWSQLRHLRSSGLTKPVVYGVCAGVFLGIYLASWMGALLFVLIISGFLLVQFFVEHLRKTPTDYLCLVGVATFLSTLVVFLVFSQHRNTAVVLSMAVVLSVALFAISRLMVIMRLKPVYYPVTILGVGLAALFILRAAWPSLMNPMLDNFEIFVWDKEATVSEMVPFLYQRTSAGVVEFSLGPFWQVYGFSMLFSIVALCILGYRMVMRWEAERVFFVIWAVVILLAALGQRRFNYYLVVNVALLTGYLCWEILRFAGLRVLAEESGVYPRDRKKLPRSKRKRDPQREPYRLRPSHAFVTLAAIAVFALFTIVPYASLDLEGTGTPRPASVIDLAAETADLDPDQPRYAPPDAWMEALRWLSENTTEPFGDTDFYYSRYETPIDYSAYPEAYGVTAWWDYGYWVARIGRRPPSQNPAGAIPSVAEFFLAQDESEGQRILDEHGARYVILDFDFVVGKFHGAVSVTGKSRQDYYDQFVVETSDGGLELTTLYLPAYYQSMSVRLFNFGGKAVTPGPDDCMVISWTWWESEGVYYKRVTETQTFDLYEAALAWIASQSSGNYNVVSYSPFISPVPLEDLEGFALRYDSETTKSVSKTETIPQVRVFEYVK